jgi:cell division protein FtsB
MKKGSWIFISIKVHFPFCLCRKLNNNDREGESNMTLKWILSLSVPVLFILVLQYRFWWDDTGVVASWQLQQQMTEIEQDIAAQQVRNDWLRGEVDDLHRSDELIEEKAREDLGFIGEDESFYLILDK